MPESLATATCIKLLGRVMPEIKLNVDAAENESDLVGKPFLDQVLMRKDAQFARIYGYVHQSVYTEVARPMLFLVHGPGDALNDDQSLIDNQGLAFSDLSLSKDLKVWTYDRTDFSCCLGVDTGPLGALLGGAAGSFAGQDVRAGGQDVRMGGQDVRMGGQDVRMGGQDMRAR